MANTPQARKRIRRNERRAEINGNRISRIRSQVKKVEAAIISSASRKWRSFSPISLSDEYTLHGPELPPRTPFFARASRPLASSIKIFAECFGSFDQSVDSSR